MRFVSRQADDSVNVSKTHPLVEAGTLYVGLTGLFLLLAVVLIFLVEAALYFVSPEDEARLFRDWLPTDLRTVAPHDDRLVATQSLVDRLARHWPDAPYEFRVEIDDSSLANAMALPGGLIVVTEGLLAEVESENELAFVLAHELGHFRHRDHLRALGRGLVLSIVFTALSGGDADGVGIRVADLTIRRFGRGQESDADAYALSLVQSQYGHVADASRLFERWHARDNVAGAKVLAYFATHPATQQRIDDLTALAAASGWSPEGDVRPLPWTVAGPESKE